MNNDKVNLWQWILTVVFSLTVALLLFILKGEKETLTDLRTRLQMVETQMAGMNSLATEWGRRLTRIEEKVDQLLERQ